MLALGCGEGSFLNLFEEDGWECYGVERSKERLQKARENTSAHLIKADIEEELPFSHPFDVVVLRTVLEHLRSPYCFLKRVKDVLKEKGILYLVVPNALNVTLRQYALGARLLGR